MAEIYNWNGLSADEKKVILDFTVKNNARIREYLRAAYPDLYTGREHEEVARGWLMIAGFESVKKFIAEG